ncbi:kinase-like protein [Heliocybe sulcata]|uniref:1-phosphatidylinositol 4-kinase n=1 Tax=Heliocybe sulcata TaxID=5364 RepID=A0A5C3NC42_9AGAM|nr:kinase-like protein [Heliocybe sulcata]
MSHALLLRLFLSPSFFSVHVALQYLRLYSDNVGITYYLTRRLRELDIDELRDVWGFICHLLVTRPSKSRAVECFVVDTCRRSTHIAMLTLWFMQAHLRDLSSSIHQNPKSFAVCQSTLLQCHEIIFGDLPAPAAMPYSILDSIFGTSRKKIKCNAFPALVGMGMVMAGVPGLPPLTEVMGEVVLEQGRAEDDISDGQTIRISGEEAAPAVPPPNQTNDEEEEEGHDVESSDSDDHRMGSRVDLSELRPQEGKRALTGSDRIAGASLARRSTIGAARTSPALPLHLRGEGRPRLSDDPFGQQDYSSPASPFQSSPSLSAAKTLREMNRLNTPDLLLQKYDLQSQVHLLRSHYCRSEVQFILGLEDICARLLVVPKPARVSALRAELTTLNHKLPAEVCMPMWCSSSDMPLSLPSKTQPHHRIVRIPPGESVVLNSAERAPFLLLMEILHDDLDFDPSKRSNKEVLKKIVTKEEERKGASSDLVVFKAGPSAVSRTTSGNEGTAGFDSGLHNEPLGIPTAPDISMIPPTPTSAALPVEDEEVDLIEQVYGADGPRFSRAVDLSDSIVLPPRPRNKDLDVAAWSRSSSLPPSPAIEQGGFSGQSPFASPAIGHGQQDSTTSMSSNGQVLSLEDYSERMRTAAVMLAQLNANLHVGREPAPGTGTPSLGSAPFEPSPASSTGWSSWFSVTPPSGSTDGEDNKGPVHPSLSGYISQGRPSNTGSSGGMRLNPAEAAAIRERIMQEMIALEEERMERMRENQTMVSSEGSGMKSVEDETIIRRELSRADPSAIVFSESWSAKKSRIRHGSPYGHLANWDCVSVIVKTGGDLRQEQLAVQLIRQFQHIWQEEHCQCWVRYFRILVTGGSSGLVETITDSVSIHSIKKAEYARRLAEGRLGHVTLLDHFKTTYGDPSSAKFMRAQRNFAKSLAGYSLVTYLLQIKDRHNGNILLDREGHLVHIDFGFMLSNSPGNIGFEAAPFKLPLEYVEVMGGADSEYFREFRRLFREGFEAASKHCDSIITLVELMQKGIDSSLPCFAALGEQTAAQLRERFQPALTQPLQEHVDRLIDTSLGSNWTRLYDSYQYYAQSIL